MYCINSRYREVVSYVYEQEVIRNGQDSIFVFGYGSLIWRPDFQYTDVHQAVVPDYERRFWQASHDHRGTPSSPGRVVTMVPLEGGRCEGLVYRLPDQGRDQILAKLDEREQDGYERAWLKAIKVEGGDSVTVLTWLAEEGNPSWMGEQPMEDLAELISSRQGPSGSNRDYLLRLHEAFLEMGINDEHVSDLADRVRRLSNL